MNGYIYFQASIDMQLHCWAQETLVLNKVKSRRIMTQIRNYKSSSLFLCFPKTNFVIYFSTCSTVALSYAWPTCVYPQLYTDLSQCYQTLIASEAQLRQRHQELSGLLAQRDRDILELQVQIQQLQQQQRDQMHMLQQCRNTALYTPLHRQTNLKVTLRLFSKLYQVKLRSISVPTFFHLKAIKSQ